MFEGIVCFAMLPLMINIERRWSLPVILGSVVLLLSGTGLFLMANFDARATIPPASPSGNLTMPGAPTSTEGMPQWSEWDDLGGSFNAGPSVASWGVNRLDVFARAAGQIMVHRTYNGTKWYPPDDLGPAIAGGPGAVASGQNRLDIFVRGADNQLWQKSWSRGWMGYFPLGGFLTSSPTVSSWGRNRLDVFVRGSDNALYHKSWTGTG
jgi:hypothetical protein